MSLEEVLNEADRSYAANNSEAYELGVQCANEIGTKVKSVRKINTDTYFIYADHFDSDTAFYKMYNGCINRKEFTAGFNSTGVLELVKIEDYKPNTGLYFKRATKK